MLTADHVLGDGAPRRSRRDELVTGRHERRCRRRGYGCRSRLILSRQESEYVFLADPSAFAGAFDLAEVDGVLLRETTRQWRHFLWSRDAGQLMAYAAIADRDRPMGSLDSRCWRSLRRRCAARGYRGGSGYSGVHLGDIRANLDCLIFFYQDPGERTGEGRRHFLGDLIGDDLNQRLILLDGITFVFQPAPNGS